VQELTVTVRWSAAEEFDPEEIMPGVALLPRFTATAWGGPLPSTVKIEAHLSEGQYRVRAISSEEGLTTDMLRKIPVSQILQRAKPSVLRKLRQIGVSVESEPAPVDRKLGGPTDEMLHSVAVAYRVAHAFDQPPTDAVAEQFGLPRSTAGRWVSEARRAGLLGDALGTKAGEVTKRKRAR
jgi:hypothetical protein